MKYTTYRKSEIGFKTRSLIINSKCAYLRYKNIKQ